ncbi:MAG: hypothetical protein WCS99_12640 [Limisphaerales bacterium]
MKTIKRRQLAREPKALSSLEPGETAHIPDGKAGFHVTRLKANKVTAEEMFAELGKLAEHCPPFDTLKLSEDEA